LEEGKVEGSIHAKKLILKKDEVKTAKNQYDCHINFIIQKKSFFSAPVSVDTTTQTKDEPKIEPKAASNTVSNSNSNENNNQQETQVKSQEPAVMGNILNAY